MSKVFQLVAAVVFAAIAAASLLGLATAAPQGEVAEAAEACQKDSLPCRILLIRPSYDT